MSRKEHEIGDKTVKNGRYGTMIRCSVYGPKQQGILVSF